MASLVLEREVPDAAAATAARLLGRPVARAVPVPGGGNNALYRVEAPPKTYALKRYSRDRRDPRDRLAAEHGAIAFLARHDVPSVPRPVAVDRRAGVALYEWIEGTRPDPVSAADIDAALALLERLKALRGEPGAERLPLASAACLSPRDAVAQVESRFVRLCWRGDPTAALEGFLEDAVLPAYHRVLAGLEARAASTGCALDRPLPAALRTLSPSDFGFHNALRRDDGSLVFLDFEYFGWDDPAKLACDVLWHPGHGLDAAVRARFRDGMLALFADDPGFAERLEILRPLTGLCWVLIMLNAYLPESPAGAGEPDALAAERARRMDRAAALLDELETRW